MTDWSVGAVTPGGVGPGSGLEGSAGTPASRSVSASAMSDERRGGYCWVEVGPGVGAAAGGVVDSAAAVVFGAACEVRVFGKGVVSTLTLTASWTSADALRNSRMLLPSAEPTSGSLPGPRISSAI